MKAKTSSKSSSARGSHRGAPSRVPKALIRTKADRAAIAAGCWFDLAAAERVRDFFRDFLRHSKGRWAGQPFELLPWEWERVIKPLFGWKRPDGTRRFREAYVEVPKKNGKSTLWAGLGLYLLVADGEAGAEIYSAAADREQSGIVFNEASAMVAASTELSAHLEVIPSTGRIVFPRANSFYKALSSEVATKHGLNIHALIFDELHAQRTRDLWDALEHGTAARAQPLKMAITTAGFDRESICYEQHHYAEQILDGTLEDISFLAVIFAAGADDDWTKPWTWKKANPSLGTIFTLEEMKAACEKAQASPTKENNFKRLRLNIWTQQAVRWLQLARWDACDAPVDPADLLGRDCFGGLDLSSTTDVSTLVLLFPDDDGRYLIWPHFWIPEASAARRERTDKVPYLTWARQGLIDTTPGEVIDYDRIRAKVNALGERYHIREIALDRWNATQLGTQLDGDGFTVIPFGQGYASMSAPTKELEKLVIAAKIAHGGNPVLRWMAGNVAVEQDAAGNLKPSKAKSTERIDGIVGAIMALGRAMVTPAGSVYDSKGIERV